MEELAILHYFRVIKEKWRIWVSIFIVAEITTLIVSIRMAPIYESTATVLPPRITGERSILIPGESPYMFKEKMPEFFLYGGGNPSQAIISMLKSKRMAKDVVKEFGLSNIYGGGSVSSAVKKLQNSTDISVSREGALSVIVRSRDPELAASIANFCISNLERINDELKVTNVKPVVTLLDSAVPAEYPLSPKVKLNLLIAGVLSLFIGFLLSFFINYIQSLKNPEA